LLSFDEVTRLGHIFASLGVKKFRITGGEPLLRKNLPDLIERLANIPGIEDIGLTTKGVMVGQQADGLYNAGFKRLNLSLDALSPDAFGEMNGRGTNPQII